MDIQIICKGNDFNEFKKYNLVIINEILDLDILTDINKKYQEFKIGFNDKQIFGLASSILNDLRK